MCKKNIYSYEPCLPKNLCTEAKQGALCPWKQDVFIYPFHKWLVSVHIKHAKRSRNVFLPPLLRKTNDISHFEMFVPSTRHGKTDSKNQFSNKF